jgi:hypothetical protein
VEQRLEKNDLNDFPLLVAAWRRGIFEVLGFDAKLRHGFRPVMSPNKHQPSHYCGRVHPDLSSTIALRAASYRHSLTYFAIFFVSCFTLGSPIWNTHNAYLPSIHGDRTLTMSDTYVAKPMPHFPDELWNLILSYLHWQDWTILIPSVPMWSLYSCDTNFGSYSGVRVTLGN